MTILIGIATSIKASLNVADGIRWPECSENLSLSKPLTFFVRLCFSQGSGNVAYVKWASC